MLANINRPTLAIGANPDVDAVLELQELLNLRMQGQSGFINIVPLAVDGDFGARTEQAVQTYQEYVALTRDGIVGERTWGSLLQTHFPDITGHWAADYITTLVNMGILRGDTEGNFRPDDPMTRGQFAQVIMASFNRILEAQRSAIPFIDVSGPDALSIRRVYEAGVMSGFDNSTFQPHASIRRQDVLVAFSKILPKPRVGGIEALDFYDDANRISDYAKESVAETSLQGVVVNHPNIRRLNPLRVATRAEVAAILERAIVMYVIGQRQVGQAPDLGYFVPFLPIASSFAVRSIDLRHNLRIISA